MAPRSCSGTSANTQTIEMSAMRKRTWPAGAFMPSIALARAPARHAAQTRRSSAGRCACAPFRRSPTDTHSSHATSATIRDRSTDLTRAGKDDVRSIAHHAGVNDRRAAIVGAVLARIRLEAQIALPELARVAILGGDAVGVPANLDGFHALVGADRLQVGHGSAHHSAHHPA